MGFIERTLRAKDLNSAIHAVASLSGYSVSICRSSEQAESL